jgi:thioredoxin 1
MSVKNLTDSEFQNLLKTEAVYIVDFWATWCPPCKVMGPIFEELSDDSDLQKIQFLKLDVDENPETAQLFGISSIPTFCVFVTTGKEDFDLKNNVKANFIGTLPKADFKEKILEILKNI